MDFEQQDKMAVAVKFIKSYFDKPVLDFMPIWYDLVLKICHSPLLKKNFAGQSHNKNNCFSRFKT